MGNHTPLVHKRLITAHLTLIGVAKVLKEMLKNLPTDYNLGLHQPEVVFKDMDSMYLINTLYETKPRA